MADRFIPLTSRTGARVAVSRDEVLDPAFAPECLEALDRYGVLTFPRIGFDDDELVAFSENLGEILPIGGKTIYKITLDRRLNPIGAEYLKNTIGWHIDGLFEDAPPPRASILTPRRLSATGGQTEFCNTYAAYLDLPETDRQRCESLRVLHSLEASNRAMSPHNSPEDDEAFRKAQAWRESHEQKRAKEHPLVWRHGSGRRSLVLGTSTEHVVGLPAEESRALVDRLTAHTTRPENVYRHEWQPGDVLMWDNWGVMHRVIPYDRDSGRLLHRTTLRGTERIEGVQALERAS
jgi:alpha-ketoglutarate-dependent taurine dioxygenase